MLCTQTNFPLQNTVPGKNALISSRRRTLDDYAMAVYLRCISTEDLEEILWRESLAIGLSFQVFRVCRSGPDHLQELPVQTARSLYLKRQVADSASVDRMFANIFAKRINLKEY